MIGPGAQFRVLEKRKWAPGTVEDQGGSDVGQEHVLSVSVALPVCGEYYGVSTACE